VSDTSLHESDAAQSTPASAASAPVPPGEAEPVWYFLGHHFYAGNQPKFYDTTELPAAKILREHYPEIKAEIEAFYATQSKELRANFTPYGLNPGWRTINLYSYHLRYRRVCRKFPIVDRVVRSIPGMYHVQIAVLKPHTVIRGHMGDTSALIRHHLGIVVPGTLPELGIRVGREEQCWKEGEVLALQIARRHKAWNETDDYRIILTVDTVRPEYADRRYEIGSMALASIVLKGIAGKWRPLKKVPLPVVRAMQRPIAWAFRSLIAAQRAYDRRFPVFADEPRL